MEQQNLKLNWKSENIILKELMNEFEINKVFICNLGSIKLQESENTRPRMALCITFPSERILSRYFEATSQPASTTIPMKESLQLGSRDRFQFHTSQARTRILLEFQR